MPTIIEKDAADHLCPYNDFKPCFGAKCMAWSWQGPSVDRCETDNLQETEEGLRPLGEPKSPGDEQWEMDGPPYRKGYHRSEKDKLPSATGQRWIKRRQVSHGCCARGGNDNQYGNF